ncbi:MAG: hypothetical protein JM58_14295 [Peptococcaceae bacterium BICA1-8]|nr:MAG: hypothetical protein JM58_14295 [Peptococcaceae bacterium BICA1-8]
MSGVAKKKGQRKKFTILLSLVILVSLSIMGISYSYLSDDLKLEVTCDSGELEAQVQLVPGSNWLSDGTNLSLNVVNVITGTKYPASFIITNTGSIPIEYRKILENDPNTILTKFTVPGNWTPLGSGKNSIIYEIEATAPMVAGPYSFTYKIETRQWIP